MSRRTIALGLGLALLAPLAGPWAPAVGPVAGADAFALPAFQQVWARADEPVASGAVKRTWLWGPGPITAGQREPYADAPGGQRTVQYFDKSRMEDNAWRTGEAGRWPVTNGLLVVEMVNGRLQLGDTQFEARPAATVSVAGDPGSGATYADLAGLLNRPSSTPGTTLITSRLLPGGQVVDGQPAPAPVNASTFVEQTQHKVADPFFEFMSSVGSVDGNPYFATGFPITEPYWTEVRLGGQPKQVLLQAFERRALTYTPGNPAGFTVEMGNVGRHYYEWRFGAAPTPPPPSPSPAPTPLRLQPTPLLVPEAMRAQLSGEVAARFADRRVNLPAGLTINLFAVLNQTRFAAFSPAGDLYVADPRAGAIVVLPDRDRDGVADRQVIFASGLNRAHSLAFHDGAVYAGETNRIVRLEDRDGDLTSDSQTVIVSDLPEGGQHWTRTVTLRAGRQALRLGRLLLQRLRRERLASGDDPPVQPRRQRRARLRQGAAQLGRPRLAAGDGPPLRDRQRPRLPGRRASAGGDQRDPRRRRLWLAALPRDGYPRPALRPGRRRLRRPDRAGGRDAGPLGAAGADLRSDAHLRRHAEWRPDRRLPRLLELVAADRRQAGARPLPRWAADRRCRGLPDRLRHRRLALGPAGRRRLRPRRRALRHRRPERGHLPHHRHRLRPLAARNSPLAGASLLGTDLPQRHRGRTETESNK